ncbi:MAG: ABC-type uncharacterized transport system, auxiliary component [Fibrobacteria bacterium]|jgi:hypothetical protein|nr:ABC-type uncharacterized transport system, auxiliary component [Fibrobacteria bacterium]
MPRFRASSPLGVLPLLAALAGACLGARPAGAALLEGLPGREVVPTVPSPAASGPAPAAPDTQVGVNWLSPPLHLQLSRDPALITIGKGAVFLPTYSESRREPEIVVLNRAGSVVATGQTGTRVLLDSGTYEVRFGSGSTNRRLRATVRVNEGHTTIVPPTWGGLIVETLNESGGYIDGEYDLVSMDQWINYGRGQGYEEERLQDIEVWILPPGLYRISRVGEGYNSLRNYITVQVNPGELHSVEAIFNDAGNLIAGGVKTLNTRKRAGQYWTYGLRAGGNAALTHQVDDLDETDRSALFSTDMRLRARYDREDFFGITEVFMQNSFLKQDEEPLEVTQDNLQLRSTWVRRLNSWVGPYVRGQVSTHLFPLEIYEDTVYIDEGADTTLLLTGGSLERQRSFYPLNFAEGAGVNVDWLSAYAIELSTQTGLAARQEISKGGYEVVDADYLGTYLLESGRTSYQVGAEGILTTKLRLSSQFTLDLRAEAFAENFKILDARLENLEADFRFFLTRNIEIGYLFQMQENTTEAPNRFPRTHSLSLRLSFNY